jgi:hypothetical protein
VQEELPLERLLVHELLEGRELRRRQLGDLEREQRPRAPGRQQPSNPDHRHAESLGEELVEPPDARAEAVPVVRDDGVDHRDGSTRA